MNKNRENRIIYSALMLLCIVGFWWFDNFYTPATYSSTSNVEKITKIPTDLLPSSTTGALVQHNHFILSYNEDYEQAEWVAYLLDRSHITGDDRRRPYFIEDPKVTTKSADWRNYKGSGYDRGHLCPAGDRRFSELAYNETFYTSNISPQQNDFNAGIWNRLEQQVRRWAKKEGPLVVITAGVLTQGLPSIGEEEVAVPRYFYKIVAKGEGGNLKIIAFLFPNREMDKSLKNFVVTVDHLEELTGIDFFQGLPEKLENNLESTVNTKAWKF
ncbi:Nuclease [Arenibacter antarcticus]|uniref:Endonuclease n=1 Tax=Arenibacter antarcticus TaxID=2040469 RepID=A0ABW5VKZ3_9FLAO|nr:DNA/RNA non-specific endonuclease [Arenibacter sp. H213]MCM4166945.1 DNA/RNA non-specific endonuclease [Arenibacter sp. H213]